MTTPSKSAEQAAREWLEKNHPYKTSWLRDVESLTSLITSREAEAERRGAEKMRQAAADSCIDLAHRLHGVPTAALTVLLHASNIRALPLTDQEPK
ncbi:hypothetical protein UFOVP1169_45 [uncultured Caudovirales phage]|uniref:Uncharacterized protein n=1 Tax=uncultured Caudovirales phage TaxID=2100421 RepID=A0A6J5QTW6_9CAUD|nr:hypothetical protein UFOVP1169_45 [uncultured Caudovirales phage]